MNIFSKLINKIKKGNKKGKKQECWYNDAAPQAPGGPNAELDGQALTSANAYDASVTQRISMS